MMRKTMVGILAAMTMAAVGCGTDTADDNLSEQSEEAGKVDAVFPKGEYVNDKPQLGDIAELTLNDDKTFSFHIQVIDCIPLQSCNTEGTYKFTRSGSARYVRFSDAADNVTRYEYKLTGDALSLRKTYTSRWFKLQRDDYAQLGETCGGFVLNPRQCAAGLQCKFGHIPDVPGTCVKKTLNACEKAGGACVALYPGSCDEGTILNANKYSCGGGLGVECCKP